MGRSSKPATVPGGPERTAADVYDEIESEFLGISIGLGRLREQLLALARRAGAQPQR